MRYFCEIAKCFSIRILWVFLFCISISLEAAPPKKNRDPLPFGLYPSGEPKSYVEQIQDPDSKSKSLGSELGDLTELVGTTVESVAAKRNIECFDDACLLQGVPLIYNRDGVGFFAGVRAKFLLLNEEDRQRLGIDFKFVRSDTKLWQYYTQVEIPRLFVRPEIKWTFRVGYQRGSDTRYLGSGEAAKIRRDQSFDYTRYFHRELQFKSSFSLTLAKWSRSAMFAVPYYSTEKVSSKSYLQDSSYLYETRPRGFEGGTLSRLGLGLMLDSRNTRYMPTRGGLTEVYYEFSKKPVGTFDFQRAGFNDRRYLTEKRKTAAFRLSVEHLFGDPPFWELDALGGSDSVDSIAGSQLMKGFLKGRFYERFKVIGNFDYRYKAKQKEVFGQTLEAYWVPISFSAARLGPQNAWGLASGAMFLFEKSFLIQTFAQYAEKNWGLHLSFGQEF